MSRTAQTWKGSEAAGEEEGVFGWGVGVGKGSVVGRPAAIDLKSEFEVEGEGGEVGGADLEECDLGTTLASSGQSVLEEAGSNALLSPKRIGSQVVDVQFIEDKRRREEADHSNVWKAWECDQGQQIGVREKVMVPLDPASAQPTAEFERHRLGDPSGGERHEARIWSLWGGTDGILARHLSSSSNRRMRFTLFAPFGGS